MKHLYLCGANKTSYLSFDICRIRDYKTFYENFDIVYVGLEIFVAMFCGLFISVCWGCWDTTLPSGIIFRLQIWSAKQEILRCLNVLNVNKRSWQGRSNSANHFYDLNFALFGKNAGKIWRRKKSKYLKDLCRSYGDVFSDF